MASSSANTAPAVSFVAQASGTVLVDAQVFSRPGGGGVIGSLRAGMPVELGGYVRVSGGLWSSKVLWLRGETASGVIFGFVAEEAVQVTAGAPLEIDVRGIPAEHFLAPSPGAVYSGGEHQVFAEAAGVDSSSRGSVVAASSAGADTALESSVAFAPSGVDASETVSTASATASGSLLRRMLGSLFAATTTEAHAAPILDLAVASGVAWMPDSVERWMPQIHAASRTHGVEPSLVAIVALVESGGNPLAQSPSGAIGLMQIMPATGQDIAEIRGIHDFSVDQLWTPETNIDFGAWYLARQLQSFAVDEDPDWQRSVTLAASAYNGGPGTVLAHLGSGRALPAETQRYQAWVGGMWNERGGAASPTFEAWWWAGGSRLVEAARAQLASR